MISKAAWKLYERYLEGGKRFQRRSGARLPLKYSPKMFDTRPDFTSPAADRRSSRMWRPSKQSSLAATLALEMCQVTTNTHYSLGCSYRQTARFLPSAMIRFESLRKARF